MSLLKDRNKLILRLNSALAASRGAATDAHVQIANNEVLEALKVRLNAVIDEVIEHDPARAQAELSDIGEHLDDLQSPNFFSAAPEHRVSIPPLAGVDAHLDETPVWSVVSLDLEHPKKWVEEDHGDTLVELLKKLASYERVTWKRLPTLSSHNHTWEDTSVWERSSRDRLEAQNLDDQSGWWQLHLDGKGRLFGYRTGRVLNLVWWDRDHEVYRTKPAR